MNVVDTGYMILVLVEVVEFVLFITTPWKVELGVEPDMIILNSYIIDLGMTLVSVRIIVTIYDPSYEVR